MGGPIKSFLFLVIVAVGAWAVHVYTKPKPRAPRLAPEGTYFLLHYVSVGTAHGVTGLAAGEMVRQVSAAGRAGMVRVTNGDFTGEVPEEALTNDMDLGESLAASDSEAQRALSETAAQARASAALAAGEIDARHAAEVASYDARVRKGSAVGTMRSGLTTRPTGEIVGGASAPGSYGYIIPVVATSNSTNSSKPWSQQPRWSPPKNNN